jgi:hypothetical protein
MRSSAAASQLRRFCRLGVLQANAGQFRQVTLSHTRGSADVLRRAGAFAD